MSKILLCMCLTALLFLSCAGTPETVDLKAEVAAQKHAAMEEGKYGCCLTVSCDQCLINMGGCPCGGNLMDGNPVCHECKGGWEAGGGKFPGINPADVKVMDRGGM